MKLALDNVIVTNPKEIADALAQNYSKNVTVPKTDPLFVAHRIATELKPITFKHSSMESYNVPFSNKELQSALRSSTSKSAGADSIPYTLLQYMPPQQQENLLAFYNYVWNNGFPQQWLHSILIPILKPNKVALDPDSYRLISLTNCLCKIYEKMTNKRLHHYLEVNNLIQPYQSGFRKAHSTLDPLISLEHAAKQSINNKGYCITVF